MWRELSKLFIESALNRVKLEEQQAQQGENEDACTKRFCVNFFYDYLCDYDYLLCETAYYVKLEGYCLTPGVGSSHYCMHVHSN